MVFFKEWRKKGENIKKMKKKGEIFGFFSGMEGSLPYMESGKLRSGERNAFVHRINLDSENFRNKNGPDVRFCKFSRRRENFGRNRFGIFLRFKIERISF